MQTKRLLWIVALGLGFALTLGLLMALSPSPEVAHAWPITPGVTPSPPVTRPPGPAFVKPGGSGGWCLQNDPCGSIQYAIDQCEPGNGDTIYVAGGTYTGTGAAVITVTKSITLYGGWDGSLTGEIVRNSNIHPTTLDGENVRRVVYISKNISPIIEGFIITHGRDQEGGGIYAENATPVIAGNVITNNVALWYGGGGYIRSGAPVITANAVLSNSAVYGGGGFSFSHGTVVLHGNHIAENQANYGGGLHVDSASITATANLIVHNQAISAWVTSGFEGHRLVAVNNVLANNSGTAFEIYNYHYADLIHNTIVDNGDNAVKGAYTATIILTNNIIADHAASSVIAWAGATVSASNNLFWNNGADPVTGTNAVLDNPLFVDPDGGDYHIGPASAAIGQGANAGVTTDIDGDPRPAPAGTRPDLGADEIGQRRIYLPLVLRNG